MSQNIRRRSWSERIVFLLTVSVLVWAGWGCNTRIQGCLDPNASNFDLTAEKACDDCCTFPLASITLSQKWNETNFSTGNTFFDIHSRQYKIIDLQYFLTSFVWQSSFNTDYTVDSTTANCEGEMFNYTPDINVIRPSLFVYNLGSFRTPTEIDSLGFHFGLVQDFSCLDDSLSTTPAILTPASPLWNPATNALSTIRLIINRFPTDTILDTLFLDIHHAEKIAY
ncbi:MAG TPA: hypothetical protein VFV79_02435, partial [Saprospiraceae bacterium]|nr:hypothetical protein [Saprospiraceae bacterium]